MKHDSYLRTVFTKKDRKRAALALAKLIRGKRIKFDAVACIGVSGLAMGAILADKLNKELVVVRKPEEDCHSYCDIEGPDTRKGLRWLFVDDFISSGATFRNVLQAMAAQHSGHMCIGTATYQSENMYYSVPMLVKENDENPGELRHHFGVWYDEYEDKCREGYETFVPAEATGVF
jgi:adenine/guanine phosphoribosyltransferase-like PRPP-binding protein